MVGWPIDYGCQQTQQQQSLNGPEVQTVREGGRDSESEREGAREGEEKMSTLRYTLGFCFGRERGKEQKTPRTPRTPNIQPLSTKIKKSSRRGLFSLINKYI